MKKIRIFATALLLAFTLSSCESFFDVELDDQAKIFSGKKPKSRNT